MTIEIFVVCKNEGTHKVIRVQFATYLPENGWDESWVDGMLMAKGYYAVAMFSDIESCYFNTDYCELIELE